MRLRYRSRARPASVAGPSCGTLGPVLELIKVLADYGISGCVIGAQLWYIVRLDRRLEATEKRLQEECSARVQDAKTYTDLALELDGGVRQAMSHLSKILGSGSESNGKVDYTEE